MDISLLGSLTENCLSWFPELEMGWYPVTESPYDSEYWVRYRQMDQTPCGVELTRRRLDLVEAYWNGMVVDIGIGGGRFVSEHQRAKGYDINPDAVRWLHENDKWFDPYAAQVPAVAFWDSLEHIHNPEPLLANVTHLAFISTPIYKDHAHVLRSKHYRPTEHCWYFTVAGLERFMARFGFNLLEHNSMEQECGREDIGTFVFGRHP